MNKSAVIYIPESNKFYDIVLIFFVFMKYLTRGTEKRFMEMLDYQMAGNVLEVEFAGDFLGYDDNAAKAALFDAAAKAKNIKAAGKKLKNWDSSLVVILYMLAKDAVRRGSGYDFSALPENLQRLVRLALEVDRKPVQDRGGKYSFLAALGNWGWEIFGSLKRALAFVGKTFSSLVRLCFGRAVMRRVDFLFAMEDGSYKAVGIVSLVSFMVGLILAFVGAVQLKTFGAQIYVASLVTIGMTRIMGAIMVGIIMAGRTGASYAATIGTMQVNEEIDALKTMGIPITDFLVLPRVTSLLITMPFLTILADFAGMLGGAFVGVAMLDISPQEYWKYSQDALNMTNFLVGLFHGFVFGLIIALCGCYYGVNCGRNADSVGVATTRAVVSAIVVMIVATGIITMIFEAWGI